MTENKIKPTIEQVIYCLKAESERYSEVCEECSLYGEVGCDHCFDDTTDVAITLLEEYLQYRAIGTVEVFKELKEKNEPKIPDYEGDGCWDGHVVIDTWICPNCEKHYEVDYDDYEYCPNCGQNINHSTLTEDD